MDVLAKVPAQLFYELLVVVPLMEITGTQDFPCRPGDGRFLYVFPRIPVWFEGVFDEVPEDGIFRDPVRTEGQIVPDGRHALEIQEG